MNLAEILNKFRNNFQNYLSEIRDEVTPNS